MRKFSAKKVRAARVVTVKSPLGKLVGRVSGVTDDKHVQYIRLDNGAVDYAPLSDVIDVRR